MKLTHAERERAWALGSSMMQLLRDKGQHVGTSREEQAAIIGAEMLVGKMLGRDWTLRGRLGKFVKVTYHENKNARLIVNDTEDDKVVLVLVVGKFNDYEVPGYITQAEAVEKSKRVELAKDWTPRVVEQGDLLRIVPFSKATCLRSTHRDFWRQPSTKAQEAGPWVCIVCHPCPWDPQEPRWRDAEWQIEFGRVAKQK